VMHSGWKEDLAAPAQARVPPKLAPAYGARSPAHPHRMNG
jgi:hypothetical protein